MSYVDEPDGDWKSDVLNLKIFYNLYFPKLKYKRPELKELRDIKTNCENPKNKG